MSDTPSHKKGTVTETGETQQEQNNDHEDEVIINSDGSTSSDTHTLEDPKPVHVVGDIIQVRYVVFAPSL